MFKKDEYWKEVNLKQIVTVLAAGRRTEQLLNSKSFYVCPREVPGNEATDDDAADDDD